MSFYGNISNAGKTQIGFDKVYPNKKTMDAQAKTDGVFVGRYVLVEYDDNTYTYRQGYLKFKPDITKEKDNQVITYLIYADENCTIPYTLSKNNINTGYGIGSGDIIRAIINDVYYYFECDGTESTEGAANFRLIHLSTGIGTGSDYTLNHSIDKGDSAIFDKEFPDTGWDSTIWQKTVDGGEVVYKKIANLNSVTPTFQLEPEAPTINPIAPHFGNNSTNVNYTLHVQPNWGFKVKEAIAPEDGSDIVSDTNVSYTTVVFNEETQLDEEKVMTYPADIYFNKKGFDKENISYSDESMVDELTILPTGISGNKYVKHTNSRFNVVEMEERPDIQEITVKLPAIGNTIAHVWDLMYGDQNMNGGLVRNLDIKWGNTTGLRMVKPDPTGNGYTYETDPMESVAGCINSVHDLMGLIVSEGLQGDETLEEALEAAQTGRIYYGPLSSTSAKNGYFFKDKTFKYISFDEKEDPTSPYYDKTFDREGFAGSRKYFDLTQFLPRKYYIYSDKNFYIEESDSPTEDTLYYILGDPQRVILKDWQPVIEQINPTTGKTEKVTVYSYFINEFGDYIKDTSAKPDNKKTYYSIEAKAVTTPELIGNKPTLIWNPEDPTVLDYDAAKEGIDPDELTDNNIIEFRSGYMRMITEAGEDGVVKNVALVEVTKDLNNEFDSNSQYYYIPKYAVAIGQDATGNPASILWFVDNGKLISFTSAITNTSMSNLYEQHLVKFLPYESGKYFIIYPENDDNIEGYQRIGSQALIDINTVYYTITATAETGNLTEEGSIPEEGSEEETYYTHYYQAHKFFYKTLNGSFILSVDAKRNPENTYYLLTDKNNVLLEELDNGLYKIEPEDIEFYYPGRYYYRSIKFNDDILDNSATMKLPTNEDVDKEYLSPPNDTANGLVYYIPNEVYVVEDTSGILNQGYLWDKNVNPPDTVTLGVREQIFQWKELTGFAKTLNTIHGLILQINKFMKFGDESTRDTTTVQGCINKINDILGTFDTLNPGNVIVIDDYGRFSGSSIETDDWLTATTSTEVNKTSINLFHDEAQTAVTTKGQNEDDAPLFGESFKVAQAGIDTKGHVKTLEERTITLPTLAITDTGTKQIITDIQMSADNQKIEVSRADAGALILGAEYVTATEAAEVAPTDSINSAVGKLEYKLNILNAGSTQEGSVAYQIAQIVEADQNGSIDKLNEIAAWIVSDTTGAAKMNADIKDNADAIAELENLVGSTAVATQISDAISAALTSGETDKYALASDLKSLTERVESLENLIDADKVAAWNTQADWTEATETSPAFIKNKPDLENLVKTTTEFGYTYNGTTTQLTIDGLLAYIATLEARIAALEPSESGQETT